MNFVKKNGAGSPALPYHCSTIVGFLGQAVPVIGGPVFAILIGMILTLLLTKKEPFTAGVNYTCKEDSPGRSRLLRASAWNLTEILAKGKQSLPIILSHDCDLPDHRVHFI